MTEQRSADVPAFPITPEIWATHPDFHGMTLRDWFAGQAMAIQFGAAGTTMPFNEFARRCFDMADAMLRARAQEQP